MSPPRRAPASALRAALALPLAIVGLSGPTQAHAGPFDVEGRAPTRLVITPGDTRPDHLPQQPADGRAAPTPMHLALAGVAADLDPKQIAALRALATAGGGAKPGPPPNELARGTLLFAAHSARDGRWVTARAYRLPDGGLAVADSDTGSLRLDIARLAPLAASWPMADAGTDPGVPPGGQRQIGPGQPWPLERSLIHLDQRELGRRFLNGRPSRIAPSAVDPEADGLLVRVPRAMGAWSRLACGPEAAPGLPGLLVWIDAAPITSRLPDALLPACDELNLILVAPLRCGNDRPTADRQQLALDAVASVRRRLFIDPERVYVTGISGGGKISTHLWAGCSDVFRGAVPIVGLANYKTIMLPNNRASPPDYMLPSDVARLAALRQHRCAVMTGPPDFNYEPILSTARQMTADGLPVRVLEYPDMAHELPTATRFADALRWVDEPARERRAAAATKAKQLLDAIDRSPPTLRQRLHAVIAQAPFSPAAWTAADRLGLTPPAPPAR